MLQGMPPSPLSLDAAFSAVAEPWSPHVVADVDDFQVKVARFEGPFTWHRHDDEDELFLVHRGRLTIRFRDGDVHLSPGDLLVVPKGVEHLPVADEPCEVVLLERATTINTGDADDPRRRTTLPRLDHR